MNHNYYVYILTNASGNFYIGVTNNIERRLYEHKNGIGADHTKKYNIARLVHLEHFSDINTAIAREKQLKGWRKSKKRALVKTANPYWNDLAATSLNYN